MRLDVYDQGLAVAMVLAGTSNPAGRLPLTFYSSVDELPPFGDYDMHGRTYRYYTGTPVYPFGFGLSYARFEYGPLALTPATGGAQQGLRIATEIHNTSARAGDEVAELYLNFPNVPGTPRVALRGFQRVSLKPGERTPAISFAASAISPSTPTLIQPSLSTMTGSISAVRHRRPVPSMTSIGSRC